MPKPPPRRISAKQNLSITDECNVTFEIPAILSERLDELVKLLEREVDEADGSTVTQRTTTRKELISALILDAAADRGALEDLLESYRTAAAGDAAMPPTAKGRITIPSRAPGLRLTTDQEQKRQRGVKKPPRRNRTSTLNGTRR